MRDVLGRAANHYQIGRPYYVLPAMASAGAGYACGVPCGTSWATGVNVVGAFLLLGMACWAANEVTDSDSDAEGTTKDRWRIYVSGGTKKIARGEISRTSAIIYSICLAVAGLVVSSYMGMKFTICAALFLAIGMAYSIRPIRLKERGVWGLSAVAVAYGVVSFYAGCAASSQVPSAASLLLAGLLTIAFFGFEGVAHLIDHEQDTRNGEKTLAVALGPQLARYVLATCQSIPAIAISIVYLVSGGTLQAGSTAVAFVLVTIAVAFSIATLRWQNERQLCSLRVLSVPAMALMVIPLL